MFIVLLCLDIISKCFLITGRFWFFRKRCGRTWQWTDDHRVTRLPETSGIIYVSDCRQLNVIRIIPFSWCETLMEKSWRFLYTNGTLDSQTSLVHCEAKISLCHCYCVFRIKFWCILLIWKIFSKFFQESEIYTFHESIVIIKIAQDFANKTKAKIICHRTI